MNDAEWPGRWWAGAQAWGAGAVRERLRPDRVQVLQILAAILAFAALMPSTNLPTLGTADWSWTDWTWYGRGVENLVHGRPLYDPVMVGGPYAFLGGPHTGAYNMPPWDIPLFVPFAALGDAARLAWGATMAFATIAAALLVTRGRRWLAFALLLIVPPSLMLLVWGNLGSLVVLGVALWLVGRERDDERLMLAGVLLASVKVLPAIPLTLVMLRERRWRPVAAAAALELAISLALVLVTGRNVLADFAAVMLNASQLPFYNLAPSLALGHQLEIRLASCVALGLLVVPRPSSWTIAAMLLVICGFVTNLYNEWLLPPLLVLVYAASRATADDRAMPIGGWRPPEAVIPSGR